MRPRFTIATGDVPASMRARSLLRGAYSASNGDTGTSVIGAHYITAIAA